MTDWYWRGILLEVSAAAIVRFTQSTASLAQPRLCCAWIQKRSQSLTLWCRGVWSALDCYLYPSDPSASAWASVVISMTIFVCYFVLLCFQLLPKTNSIESGWTSLFGRLYTLVLGACGAARWASSPEKCRCCVRYVLAWCVELADN